MKNKNIFIVFLLSFALIGEAHAKEWSVTTGSNGAYPATLYNSSGGYVGGAASVQLRDGNSTVSAVCIDPYASGCTSTGSGYQETSLSAADYAAYSAIMNADGYTDEEKVTAMKAYSVLNSNNTRGTEDDSVKNLYAASVKSDFKNGKDANGNSSGFSDAELKNYQDLYNIGVNAASGVPPVASKIEYVKSPFLITKSAYENKKITSGKYAFLNNEHNMDITKSLLSLDSNKSAKSKDGNVSVYNKNNYVFTFGSKEELTALKNKGAICTEYVGNGYYSYSCDLSQTCSECLNAGDGVKCKSITDETLKKQCLKENCKGELNLDEYNPGAADCPDGWNKDASGNCVKDEPTGGGGTNPGTSPVASGDCKVKVYESSTSDCQRQLACIDEYGNNEIGTEKDDSKVDGSDIADLLKDDDDIATGGEDFDNVISYDCGEYADGLAYTCEPLAQSWVANPDGSSYCDINGTTVATIYEVYEQDADVIASCAFGDAPTYVDYAGNPNDATDLLYGGDQKVTETKLNEHSTTLSDGAKLDACNAVCTEDYFLNLPGPTSNPGNNIGDDGIVSVNAGTFFNINFGDSSNHLAYSETRVKCYIKPNYSNIVKAINSARQASATAYNNNLMYHASKSMNNLVGFTTDDGSTVTVIAGYEADWTGDTSYKSSVNQYECHGKSAPNCGCVPCATEENPDCCAPIPCCAASCSIIGTIPYNTGYRISSISLKIDKGKKLDDLTSDSASFTNYNYQSPTYEKIPLTDGTSKSISAYNCIIGAYTGGSPASFCGVSGNYASYDSSPNFGSILTTESCQMLFNDLYKVYSQFDDNWYNSISDQIETNISKYKEKWNQCTNPDINTIFGNINAKVFTNEDYDPANQKYMTQTNITFDYYDNAFFKKSTSFKRNDETEAPLLMTIDDIKAEPEKKENVGTEIPHRPRLDIARDTSADTSVEYNEYSNYIDVEESVIVNYSLGVGFCQKIDGTTREEDVTIVKSSEKVDCESDGGIYQVGFPIDYNTSQGDYYYRYDYSGIGHYFDDSGHAQGSTGRLDDVVRIKYRDSLSGAAKETCHYNVNNCEKCQVVCDTKPTEILKDPCNINTHNCGGVCKMNCAKGGCVIESHAGFMANFKVVSLNSSFAINLNQSPEKIFSNEDTIGLVGVSLSGCSGYKCSSTNTFSQTNWDTSKGSAVKIEIANQKEGIYSTEPEYRVVLDNANLNTITTVTEYAGSYIKTNTDTYPYYSFESDLLDVLGSKNSLSSSTYDGDVDAEFTGPAKK